MARTLPVGQKMWIAYPGSYEQITVVERGTGGHVFKEGKKPHLPYIVRDSDDDEFIVSYDDLYDSPREAAIEATRLANEHGVREENPGDDEPGDGNDDTDPEEPEDDAED